MDTNVEAIRILQDAEDLLKRTGWIQGHYKTRLGMDGPHCATGALIAVSSPDPLQGREAAYDALYREIKGLGKTVERWNDTLRLPWLFGSWRVRRRFRRAQARIG